VASVGEDVGTTVDEPFPADTLDPPVRRENGDLVIALFSSRLGCFGSLLVSALLTALVILALYR
jgi:hypothetical protein